MIDQPHIELDNVNKHYGAYHALRDINMSIPSGAFVALVGPSGCGKSTLLRSLAGLENISGGEMKITGDLVNDVPPRKRDVAMVFQSYALYPHMTVRQNLTYSLRLKRMKKAEMAKIADEVAATIGLEDLLDRYPRELSGGQRQRVAMGRAIVRRPKVFLFDEPLSNLDAALRVYMRKEIRLLHDRLHATSVYVTHDQVEAMTMADHVVVMRTGKIEQQGAPLDLYDRPANKFVAGFIGSPAMNFVDGTIADDGASVVLDLPDSPRLVFQGNRPKGEQVVVGLRPEHLEIVDPTATPTSNLLTLPVALIECMGASSIVMSATSPEIQIAAQTRVGTNDGSVTLSIAAEKIHLFDRDQGQALLR